MSTIFVSYSHQDSTWLDRLKVHLKPLERKYPLDIWDDTKIGAGSRWLEEIRLAIENARVAILLISADFLASDFIVNNELPHLLLAARTRGKVIMPVIVGHSLFESIDELSEFQAANNPKEPLAILWIRQSRTRS